MSITKAVSVLLLVVLAYYPITAAYADEQLRAFIDARETIDAGNSKDNAKQVDFGSAIAAALVKKKVPVLIVTDPAMAEWTIKYASSQREDNTADRIRG
jgi:hypothetical protein